MASFDQFIFQIKKNHQMDLLIFEYFDCSIARTLLHFISSQIELFLKYCLTVIAFIEADYFLKNNSIVNFADHFILFFLPLYIFEFHFFIFIMSQFMLNF